MNPQRGVIFIHMITTDSLAQEQNIVQINDARTHTGYEPKATMQRLSLESIGVSRLVATAPLADTVSCVPAQVAWS